MIKPARKLPVQSLAAARNARTRIFAAGADPKFGRRTQPRLLRLELAPPTPTDWFGIGKRPLPLRSDVLDRLQPPVTRYHE